MTGLVLQLQSEAMDGAVPITDLLRKAKAVAIKLNQDDIVTWLEHEMSGYPDGAELPAYRRVSARLRFFNPVRGWCPIISGEHMVRYGGSVAEIAGLLAGEGDELQSAAPPGVVQRVSQDLDYDVDVRRFISKAAVGAIIDAVRNSVLDWALKLERAGVHGDGHSFSQKESIKAQSVVFNIGSIGNATGLGAFGSGANITANINGNVQMLAEKVTELVEKAEKALPKSEVSPDVRRAALTQLAELKEEASGKRPSESRLRQGLAVLRRIMEGAASDLTASGIEAAIDAILG